MGCELWPSVISGLVGGVLALLGVYFTLEGHRQRDKDRQEEIILSALEAIKEELNSLWGIINESVEHYWKEFEEKKDFLNCNLTVPSDYFTIYRSNANLIGQIEEPELRNKIVRVYVLLLALIEGYKKNNTWIDKYEKANYDNHQVAVLVFTKLLNQHASGLRRQHDRVAIEIECLIKMLEKRLSLKPHPIRPGFTNNSA